MRLRQTKRRWYEFERNRELTRFEEWSERNPLPGSEPTSRRSGLVNWRAVIRRDPCAYCTAAGGTIDHIVPKLRRSGPKLPQKWLNYTGACEGCNQRKGSLSLLFFLLARRVA
jgi:5-methylcytosine-specific restriction endonuclease McrA